MLMLILPRGANAYPFAATTYQCLKWHLPKSVGLVWRMAGASYAAQSVAKSVSDEITSGVREYPKGASLLDR